MKRREFIAGLGGAPVSLPIVARAQQLAVPVIGFLSSGSNDFQNANFVAGFRQGLKEVGYIEGQNIAIEFRWGEGQYDRLETMAADFVRRRVSVLFAGGPPAARVA